ncbi:MAG: sulfotransferase [Nitrococcus sp.]|nr:sulfotransferase [Nitrococcus sp.]
MSSYQPVVIIGAPSSGTNMLRDVLTPIPDVPTWPCENIN